MSPEQAAGNPLDVRSDLFSLGVVLYELLARRRPYEGKTDLEQLYARVHGPSPRIADVRGDLPPTLRVVVDKLLEKDAADRYQSARDLVVDLRRLVRDDAPPVSRPDARRSGRSVLVYAAAAVALVVAAALWVLQSRSDSDAAIDQSMLNMEQITAFSDFAVQPAFSPDGRMLTFIRGPSSFTTRGQVYVKLLPNGDPVQLTNDSQLKMMPEFTPDGSRVVYTVNTDATGSWDTWMVPVMGGEARLWLPNASGLQWIGPQAE